VLWTRSTSQASRQFKAADEIVKARWCLKEPRSCRGSSRCRPEAPSRPPTSLLSLAEQAPATFDGGVFQLVSMKEGPVSSPPRC
jgi:hypothetical protein